MTRPNPAHSNQKFICGDVIIYGGIVKRITKIANGVAEFDVGSIPIEALKNNIRRGMSMWVSKDDDKGTIRHILDFIDTDFENQFTILEKARGQAMLNLMCKLRKINSLSSDSADF